MILRPVSPASPVRAADLESAGRIDEVPRAFQHVRGQHGLDDFLDDGFGELALLLVHAGMVLRGQHHGVDRDRFAVDIADGELRLGIGAQPRQAAVLPDLALTLHEPVRVIDRERHQRGRFVARIAEHQALIARSLVEVVVGRLVDASLDVGRLPSVTHHDRAAIGVEAQFRVVVADLADRLARDPRVVVPDIRGDFAGQHDETRRDQRLGRDARVRILL